MSRRMLLWAGAVLGLWLACGLAMPDERWRVWG